MKVSRAPAAVSLLLVQVPLWIYAVVTESLYQKKKRRAS